ncbi:MAG: DUF4838 domain-containing protein, partial [Firmicutes bacterium]|nr:DUF4838 domain-containing protein [Bacillota bacterium]
KNCLRVRAQENNSNAGAVVRWTNRFAAEAEDEGYYGLKYTIFAYHGSNKPCKSACREDVYVTFCTDGHCSRHSLDGSQCQWESFDELGSLGEGYLHLNNNHYAEFVRGWSELCPNLYVWFYALDNNLHQYVILDQMYDDFKFLGECGVKGVYWQMAYTGFGVEKIEQQLGMLLDLCPEMTKEEYRAELIRLLDKTYGDGWAEIMEYIDLWEKAELAVKDCKNCWNYASITEFDAVDAETYLASWDHMIELLEAAIPKARSARQQAACEILTVSMYYLGCNIEYFDAYTANDTARLEVLAARWALIIERLRSNRFNIALITGQDNVKFRLDEDINKMAWSQWAKSGDFARYYPDVDVDSLDLPAEWLEE